MILRELVRDAARRLRKAPLHYGHGTTNARDEAAFLVLRGLGLPFEAHAELRVSGREETRVAKLLERRIRERIPVPYLLHEAWLAGERFYVDRRVIVPRSHIAELLQKRLLPLAREPRRVLDLCTGSGCLAILAAKAFPRARVDATDISAPALEVAARNIALHGLRRRVTLARSDLFSALSGWAYDLILCNPPYVTAASMRALPREYRYEPRKALAAGQDGLDFIRRLLVDVPRHLVPRGLLVCEIGAGRRAMERAYPRLSFTWTQGGTVLLLAREELG